MRWGNPFSLEDPWLKTAREYARIKIDGLRLVGGPGTATTTHASTTGSKLTYTLAGDSPENPPQARSWLSYPTDLRNRRNQS